LGVPAALPPLYRAAEVGRRAAAVGFDWPSAAPVWAKLDEELDELREALARQDQPAAEAELGDVLFTLVNLARHLGLDAEAGLESTLTKFGRRFRAVERARRGGAEGLAALDAAWERAKEEEGASALDREQSDP
jgi:uncharacterized protein YabN with tetrapyrrole methylase and pyrophosphatase domain